MLHASDNRARALALAASVIAFWPGSARAACPAWNDVDGDGYGKVPYAGCPALLDCNDTQAATNPLQLEDVVNDRDDNCNGRRDAMQVYFGDGAFPSAQWTDTGSVLHSGSGVRVGITTTAAVASTVRFITKPVNTGLIAAIDVTSVSGPGCSVQLGTTPAGAPATPISWTTGLTVNTTAGVQLLDFTPYLSPAYVVRRVKLQCPASTQMWVDWVQLQDSTVVFPPPEDVDLTWKDTAMPGGGHTTALLRDDGSGTFYMATDMNGVSRYDGTYWTTSNGFGADSLLASGDLGVAELLPMQDGSDEVFVLLGDTNGDDGLGGLWWSDDRGDSWTELASGLDDFPSGSGSPADTNDDVAGDPRQSHCNAGGASGFQQAGGHLLVAHSIPAQSGDVVYIGNADAAVRGVSIWDGSDACVMPLAAGSDPLPADYVSALLRVDALPNGTELLVVGYRARFGGAASLFLCELPVGGPVCGGSGAFCEEVTLGSGGTDVRDLEVDAWLQGEEETDMVGVLVADGGWRPVDANADGEADAACEASAGNVSELLISDAGGTLTIAVDLDVVDATQLATYSAGAPITGISFDPTAEYLFINSPFGPNLRYDFDSITRVNADDLFLGGAPVFEGLNSTGVDLREEGVYEAVRRVGDTDFSGGWLEVDLNGRPYPFAARHAPGAAPDLHWYWEVVGGAAVRVATAINGNEAWRIDGLADDWTDNEATEPPWDTDAQPEGDVFFTFWPDIDLATHQTSQSVVTFDTTIAPDGHVWTAVGDLGLTHWYPYSAPFGSEVDCLFAGWGAAANSIDSVEAIEPTDEGVPVVWLTVRDANTTGYNHENGVMRTMDNGSTWEYAGAGFASEPGEAAYALVEDSEDPDLVGGLRDAKYGLRACDDLDDGHVAKPFDDGDSTNADYSPAHAFAAESLPENAQLTTKPVLGQTRHIRALNERAAVVLLGPDGDSGAAGGLFLTTDGGGHWTALDYDAGPANCVEATTMNGGRFEIFHPGTDSRWVGQSGDPTLLDEVTFELVLSVVNPEYTGTESAPGITQCSIAVVSIYADSTGFVDTSWTWHTLPFTSYTNLDTANACGVAPNILTSAVPADWSDEVMLTGRYRRTLNGAKNAVVNVQGGACLFNLSTGAMKMVVDPRKYTAGVEAAAAHPQIADLWALGTAPDEAHCAKLYAVSPSSYPSLYLGCSLPTPVLVSGTSAAYTVRNLTDTYPHNASIDVEWSPLNVPDETLEQAGSYLIVSTYGGGTWRGEVSW